MAPIQGPLFTVLLCFIVGVWNLKFNSALEEANAVDDEVRLVNLDDECRHCICYAATGCNLAYGCDTESYCGPFKIGKLYWIDSGRVTLKGDDPDREGAFPDCANDFDCAKRIVNGYVKQWGKDCNDDGVTDCKDFMKIHFNGGFQCHPPLERYEKGRIALQKFQDCQTGAANVSLPNFN